MYSKLCKCGNEECIVHAGESCENAHPREGGVICLDCQEVWNNFHAAIAGQE